MTPTQAMIKHIAAEATGWAIVMKNGRFADDRAGYSFFDTKRQAKLWVMPDSGERVCRVKITEITGTAEKRE